MSEPLTLAGQNWPAALAGSGWTVARNLVPPDLAVALAEEARALHAAGALTPAGIGRADDHTLARAIRRDKTLWLSRQSPVQADYLDLMEVVRLELNRALFLGLWSYEAHFAVYETGGFYARHVDAFKGARNRIVSTVFYLNPDWREADGGALVLYPENGPDVTVLPEFGTMALFLSEDIPHEVCPALRPRYSIAGWFRLNDRAVSPALQAPTPLAREPGAG